jgi:NADH:ubiquinone oxidoreductase subunit 6 (subunit J)
MHRNALSGRALIDLKSVGVCAKLHNRFCTLQDNTMTEFLFGLFAIVAVASAVFMVTSPTRNAVHSALALVVTMACLAFLFLMLDAPFLAMIQITVYAGAIMVLFIFVIMLLGAEKLDVRETKFPWFFGAGVTLVITLLFSLLIPFFLANVSETQPAPAEPRVRVVHAAPDLPAVDVALNDTVIASGLVRTQASAFVSLPAGDYTVTVTPAGGAPVTTTLSLATGTTQTVVTYGEGSTPLFAVIPDDLSTIAGVRGSRVTFFNAFDAATPVSLVSFGSEFDNNDTLTYVDEVAYGAASAPVVLEAGSYDLAYIAGSDVPESDNETVLFRQRDYALPRDHAQLFVLTAERQFDGTLRAQGLPVSVEARPLFGSPRAIGTLLFIDYMLPFQLLAILLLAAMVGAIVLTRQHVSPTKPRLAVRRRVTRPLTNVIASQVGHEVVEEHSPRLPAQTDERESVGD